ncbi:multicopper oxidase family protein [Salinicoccus roseus]|uniref:multicopper oxidase family protein n=1 Tax=Salinicoccus roseus TaxID=45670 RepID=UPI0035623F55
MAVVVLSACTNNAGKASVENNDDGKTTNGGMNMERHDESFMGESMNDHSMEEEMDGASMDNGHMDHDNVVSLNDSTGKDELGIPPLLQSGSDEKTEYTIRAQKGETEIFDGVQTKTYGYNSSFLGPMLQFEKGETVTINLINELDDNTTFHWHGLEVAGNEDGGPHEVLEPGEEDTIEFEVTQEAATLWFHPHPEGETSEQVYNGLAGLIYIEDQNSKNLELPSDYGKNDIPLVFQDKIFDDEKQLNYEAAANEDGTVGDTSLINGTLNPKLTVDKEKVRLRLLNGSNARNYIFKLNTGDSFVQIATDGGFLNEPVSMNEITLTPSERAEIIVDFSKMNSNENVALINEDDGSTLLPFEITDQIGKNTELPDEMNDFSVTEEEMNMPVTKEIELFGMMDMVTINGKKFDPERIDFTQKQGVTEVWEIYNKPDMMGGMIHPFHIHGAQFKILSRNGETPPENERGWKDSFSVVPNETVKIAIQFKNKGIYMFHCHILEHEDNGMMGQVKVE